MAHVNDNEMEVAALPISDYPFGFQLLMKQ